MPFPNLIAQRRRQSMMQNQVSNTEPPQNDYRREIALNNPEPERIPRPPDVDRSPEYREQLSEIRGNTPMTNQYRQMLSQTPAREDYRPGKLDRLTASLGGVSAGLRGGAVAGVNTARGILDTDYRRALEDHNRNLEGAKSGADLEHRDVGYRVDDYKTGLAQRDTDFTRADTRYQGDRANELARFGARTSQQQADTQTLDTLNRGDYYRGQNKIAGDRVDLSRDQLEASNSQFERELGQKLEIENARFAQIDPQDRLAVQQEAMRNVASTGEYEKYFNIDNPDFPMLDPDTPHEIRLIIEEEIFDYVEQFLNQTPRAF